MLDIIILAAGSGKRTKLDYNKALYKINDIPLFMYSINNLKKYSDNIILVYNELDLNELSKYDLKNITLVKGGRERNLSVLNALSYCKNDYLLIHDACRIFTPLDKLEELINNHTNYDCSFFGSKEINTTYYLKDNKLTFLDRNKLICAETPQIIKRELYLKALNYSNNITFTDDISLILNYKNDISFNIIETNHENFKITNSKDLLKARMVIEDV